MSSIRNTISHSGMLKNMLSQNFSELDCLRELIDDSISAKAARIRITAISDQNLLVTADDGTGMTRDGLNQGHVFHNRSGPSNRKHGRFGIGRKTALAVLTKLEHAVDTFSSPLEDIPKAAPGSVYELIVDFPEYLENDNIDIRATGITSAKQHIWDTYKLAGHGTISYIPCNAATFQKVMNGFRSTSPETNISYIFGCTYAKYLSEGGSIVLDIDGVQTNLVAVDFLNWDNIHDANKSERTLQIYLTAEGSEVYAYYTGRNGQGRKGLYDPSGSLGRMNFHKDSRANRFEDDSQPQLDSHEFLGSVRIRSAYTEDWIESHNAVLTTYGLDIPNKGDDGRQAVEKALCGTVLSRNGKVVTRFPAERPTAGDKAKYPIAERSNHEISFEAVLAEDGDERKALDNVFGILVNKSKIDENQICQHVRKTIKHLQDQFVTAQYKATLPVADEEQNPLQPVDEILPVRPVREEPVYELAEEAIQDIIPIGVPSPVTHVGVAIAATEGPIKVAEHTRSTPKSRRFIIHELINLLDPLGPDPIARLRQYAMSESNEPEEGISAHVRSISFMKTILEKYYD